MPRSMTHGEADPELETIASWLAQNVDGTVLEVTRQPRWRPVWFVDVDRKAERMQLCVRGDRVDGAAPWPHKHEMTLFVALERAGIPVPHVHGWIDGS
ncbi:MAG: hypothetical protein ACHQNA_07415, partial [Acidimicrobiales bacterium]